MPGRCVARSRQEGAGLLVHFVIVSPPAEGQVDDGPRLADRVEGTERLQDHGALLPDMTGFAKRVTEGPFQENGTGWPDLFGVIAHDRNADSRDTGLLDGSLDQPHGLVAEASGWRQQDHVHPVPSQGLGNLRRRFLDQGHKMAAVDVAHERIVTFRHFTDNAFLLQLP